MPNYLPAAIVAAASNALAGRPAEAQRAMARVRQLDPPLRIKLFLIKQPEDFAGWKEGLRLAGLPE